jgi:hypothetical protein
MKMLDSFSDSRQVDHYGNVSKLMLGVYQVHGLEHSDTIGGRVDRGSSLSSIAS